MVYDNSSLVDNTIFMSVLDKMKNFIDVFVACNCIYNYKKGYYCRLVYKGYYKTVHYRVAISKFLLTRTSISLLVLSFYLVDRGTYYIC